MADFTVPGTWTYNGSANANQTSFRVSGHTAAENYLVIFDRKPQTSVNGKFTKPSMRARIIRSFVDANGVPLVSKAVTDVNHSWPVEAPASDVKAMLTLLGTIFSDANIAANWVDDQIIPGL